MTPTSRPGNGFSSHTLRNGWPSAPRVRVRLARTEDLEAAAALIPLAGAAQLEQLMIDAVEAGLLGGALAAGLDHGPRALREDVLRYIAADDGDFARDLLRVSLILVADHRDHGVLGVLQACPPQRFAGRAGC